MKSSVKSQRKGRRFGACMWPYLPLVRPVWTDGGRPQGLIREKVNRWPASVITEGTVRQQLVRSKR